MSVLTIGKKSNKELAEWFNITPGAFANRKKIKLKELAYFAKFHEEKTKIVIDEVYIPEYSRQSIRNFEKVHQKYPAHWGDNGYGLDIGKRVASELHSKLKEDEDYTVQESTTYTLVLRAIKKDYGKRGDPEGGELGRSYYQLGKINEQTGKIEPFTLEEQKIKKEIMRKFFNDDDENILHIMKQHDDGELNDQDFAIRIKEAKNYNTINYQVFISELSAALNKVIKRGIYLEPSTFKRQLE